MGEAIIQWLLHDWSNLVIVLQTTVKQMKIQVLSTNFRVPPSSFIFPSFLWPFPSWFMRIFAGVGLTSASVGCGVNRTRVHTESTSSHSKVRLTHTSAQTEGFVHLVTGNLQAQENFNQLCNARKEPGTRSTAVLPRVPGEYGFTLRLLLYFPSRVSPTQ